MVGFDDAGRGHEPRNIYIENRKGKKPNSDISVLAQFQTSGTVRE